MALYAFDGTWNSDRKGAERDSNVVWFRNAYRGRVEYQKGVGTRLGRAGNVAGGISGAGGRSRVKKALEALERNFRSDRTIDVVGFSRGAALALHFANQIEKRWARRTIRFLGLWDTVPSFGVPGSPWNIGWDLDLPDNVQTCFHALALDERRRTFALHRLEARVADVDQPGRLFELWFRGVHSDVGGGNHNPGLSSISLNWMFANAAACGVDLDDAVVDENRRRLDPDRAISPPPGYAKLPGGRRIVRWNDQVHASVTVRSGAKHNNPPTGIVRVDDSGEVVGKLAVPADSRRRRRRPRRG